MRSLLWEFLVILIKNLTKLLQKKEQELLRQKKAQGGTCRSCRYYDAFRGVCTNGSGHITSANNVCPYWKI